MDLHIIQKDWLTLKYLVTSISLNMNVAHTSALRVYVCLYVWCAVQEDSERLSTVHALHAILFDFYFFRLLVAAFGFSESGSRRQNCTCIKIKPWTKCVLVCEACVGCEHWASHTQSRQQSWKCDCDRVTHSHSYEYKLFIYYMMLFFGFGFSAVRFIYCWTFDRATTHTQRNHFDPKDYCAYNTTIKTQNQRESIEFIFRNYFIGDELVRV